MFCEATFCAIHRSGALARTNRYLAGVILRSAAVSLAVVGLLTSGCSQGDAKPRSLPTVTSTVGATPSSLPVRVPSAATPATAQGAAAFVRYFFEALDQAYRQGRPFPVGELIDNRCESCRQFAGVADGLARDGYHFRESSFAHLLAEAPPLQGALSYVTLTCDLPARTKVDASDRTIVAYPAEKPMVMTVVTERRSSGWVIRTMQTQS
jgi:hypothetical protein